MFEYIISLISVSTILELPMIVQAPGWLLLLLIAVRAVRAILSFSPIKLVSSIIMFFVVAFILSRFGQAIFLMINTPPNPPT